MIIGNGAYPSPLNYHGFPKSICTSVNNVACHGIPDNRPLQEGDILNVDITVSLSFMKCLQSNISLLIRKNIINYLKKYLNFDLNRYILMVIMVIAQVCFKWVK